MCHNQSVGVHARTIPSVVYCIFFHNYYCNDNGSRMTGTTSALHEYIVFLAPIHVFVWTSQPINVKFECTRGKIYQKLSGFQT